VDQTINKVIRGLTYYYMLPTLIYVVKLRVELSETKSMTGCTELKFRITISLLMSTFDNTYGTFSLRNKIVFLKKCK